ncbi:uncharacterized protein PG986_011675 [Apiospora aurea]|uniref:Uncharacterized protein n=1 Tax=Apiospora aurea TaxID=335848 RepID=A0ABR1PYE5_9PEZI
MSKMVGEGDWSWGIKGSFLWAGVTGLTYSELDLLSEHMAKARDFSWEKAEMLKAVLVHIALQH